jgi:hypothetical protein
MSVTSTAALMLAPVEEELITKNYVNPLNPSNHGSDNLFSHKHRSANAYAS